jgi:hypothetical protein
MPLAKRICERINNLHINANGQNSQEYQPVLSEYENPYYYNTNKVSIIRCGNFKTEICGYCRPVSDLPLGSLGCSLGLEGFGHKRTEKIVF